MVEGVISLDSSTSRIPSELYGGLVTYLAGFILRDLMLGVLLAVLTLAVGATGFWDVDLCNPFISKNSSDL